MKRGRNKRVSGRVLLERRFAAQKRRGKEEAANRRKLLDKLDSSTREFAIQEFAKLGLYQ